MPRRVGDFRGLTQPSRARLLRAIQRAPGRRAKDLADECELPLNTARDHLRVLDQALVCSMHERLVRDVLHQVDGPLVLQRLDPFVTEHRCRLVLARREASVDSG